MLFPWRLDAARLVRPALPVAAVLVAGAAFAASEGEHREHEAHEHGHGTLDIAVEGEELVVEFRIPAVNVVGFEHAPRDDAEREAVRQALVPFKDAASVLAPSPEAMCEIETVEAALSSMEHEAHHEHDESHEGEGHAGDEGKEHEHEHEEDQHKQDVHDAEEHEEHGHDGDEHEEHGTDSGAEAHSELHAAYHYHCHAPERLERIVVHVFEHLHDVEEIEARVVTPTTQAAMALHPGEAVVELAP